MSHEFNSPLNVILNGFDCICVSKSLNEEETASSCLNVATGLPYLLWKLQTVRVRVYMYSIYSIYSIHMLNEILDNTLHLLRCLT